MRLQLLAAAGMIVLVTSCLGNSDQPTQVHSNHESQLAAATNGPDLIGLPDLVVDEKATQNNWLVRVEDLPANFCSVQEGNVTPGTRKVVRFTVTTPNIGDADVFVGNPIDHMDPNGDGNTSDADGMFEFASCHNHYHFQNYATYRLLGEDGREWKSAKRGFCMLDTDPYNTGSGDGTWEYRSCGTTTIGGYQGISAGWADTYSFMLAGQYFVLDGGDHQPVVPPGNYTIEVHVNPPYAPDRRGNCPLVKDAATGLCHQFAESNYANNIGRVSISIPDHPGRDGYGPLKGDKTKITAHNEAHKGQ
jgi:hypothetical protein